MMQPSSRLLLLLGSCFFFLAVSADNSGLDCYVDGECLGNLVMSITVQDDAEACLYSCKNTLACRHWTFYPNSTGCLGFVNCDGLTDEKCEDECKSGQVECEPFLCDKVGLCKGHVLNYRPAVDKAECMANCFANDKCTYWAFYESQSACSVLSDCLWIDETDTHVISGERRCYEFAEERDYSNALVLGGITNASQYETSSDLLDMSGTLYDCPTVTPIPGGRFAPATAVVNDFPIVCGGYGEQIDAQGNVTGIGVLSSCYALNTGVWNFIGDLFKGAYYSASLALRDGTFWLSGGFGVGDVILSTCETVNSAGGFDPFAVELPIPLAQHCAVLVADWTIAIVGGETTNSTSDQVWLFDVQTKVYTEITSLPTPRRQHVCQMVNNGTSLVVAGGVINGTVTDTVEILDLNYLIWSAGESLPLPIYDASSTADEEKLLLFGGLDENDNGLDTVYEFDLLAGWSLRDEVLATARWGTQAVMVDTGMSECVPK